MGLVATHLATQVATLDIDNPDDCAKKFIANRRIGLVLFLGIVLGTYLKDHQLETIPTALSNLQ